MCERDVEQVLGEHQQRVYVKPFWTTCAGLFVEELSEVLRLARGGPRACGADLPLGGTLPTQAVSDLGLGNSPRGRVITS